MGACDKVRVGIVGACGRGAELGKALSIIEAARVQAVCDLYPEPLHQVAQQLGAEDEYTDYEEMLQQAELDAVIVADVGHSSHEPDITRELVAATARIAETGSPVR